MDDSFRISSNDNKVPELSLQKTTDSTISAIRSMDPSTAFIAVKTVVVPTLSKLSAPPSQSASPSSPMELSKRQSQSMGNSSFKEMTTSLERIKSDLQDIQRLIKESESQTKNRLDRDLLKKRAIALQEKITDLEKGIPKNPLIQSLHTTVKELLDTIRKLDHKNDKRTLNAENLELSAENKKRFNKSLGDIDKNLRDIYAFSSSKEYHLKKLKSLGTQAAYVYALNTFLPFLQSQSAATLEEKGNTMKQISNLYNKWNEIQEEINEMSTNIKELFKNEVIKDQKVVFWEIIDYKGYKVGKFNDPKQLFQGLLKSKKNIDSKLEEFQKLIKEVEKKLPPSAKSLIETLKELSSNLKLNKSKDFNFYYWDDNEMRFEILAKDANLKDNEDYDKMNQLLMERLEEVYGFFISPDQTKFKSYMDNIAQGITALTSISNMTQQEVQIASQYYNSLLGLQKNGFDSIMKVIQIAAKAPNH